MKKSFLFVALLCVTAFVSAQTMKVQSAYSDMKNGRLLNAKQNIDDACKDEKTSREAKTWNYAGLIYTQIVQAIDDEKTDKKTKKELSKIKEPVLELCNIGTESFRKCLAIEKENNSTEFVKNTADAMKVLCGYKFKYIGEMYNNGEYEKSAPLFHQLVEDANAVTFKSLALDAMFFEADCYRMMQNKDKQMELYRELAKQNTDKAEVYLAIYQENKAKNDTTKAINALKKGVRMTAQETNTNILMKSSLAQAYVWAGKTDEANKIVEEMLKGGEGDTLTLVSVADICVNTGNTEKASELYKKAISLNPNYKKAYSGMGILYFNMAADENAAADKLPPDPEFDAEYNAHKKASFEAFENSIPYFTKVLEMDKNNFEALKALKTVYSQLASRSDSPQETKNAYKEKYQDVSQRLNALIQK